MADSAESWIRPDEPPPLDPGEVHVHRALLDRPAGARAAFADLLSPDERERAGTLRPGRVRDRFVVARGLLRRLLGNYLGRDPASLVFSYGEQGKPRLPDRELRFSVSHSGDVALYAFARDRAVGVDVELVREEPEVDRIADRFFSPAEADRLAALPPPDRRAAFFRLWTRKEALVKGLGLGVPSGLAEPPERAGWTVIALEPGEDRVAALAVEGEGFRLRLLQAP